ncbi:MAG: biotin transporter BioY [Anaerorhabdus sp.]|jgi:biotin transport system substrate-specific component|uniref:biotin transporter BioY n=1 Tax=Anaerorhabdus sp. TaxID=1872524 RepID=UPI002FCA56A9
MNKQLILSAIFAALIAICSQIQIPLPMVPINAALLAVHVLGALLKPKYAAISVLVFLLLGFIGLPVFSNFSGGATVLFGATGGYLVGYMFDALIISFGLTKLKRTNLNIALLATLGTIACYTFGTIWFMFVMKLDLIASLTYCVFPFIPGDIIKIVIATILIQRLQYRN